jgi:hypothetical protein
VQASDAPVAYIHAQTRREKRGPRRSQNRDLTAYSFDPEGV